MWLPLDSHGQPVTDLTAGDFQVTDADKPQKIIVFAGILEAMSRGRLPPQAPTSFQNRAESVTRNATVILLDLLNLGYGTRAFAANELVKNLNGLESADSLYLCLLSINGKFFQHPALRRSKSPPPSLRHGPGRSNR